MSWPGERRHLIVLVVAPLVLAATIWAWAGTGTRSEAEVCSTNVAMAGRPAPAGSHCERIAPDRAATPEAPTSLLADGSAAHLVGGIITQALTMAVVGAAAGAVVRLLGRRGSWWVAAVLWACGTIGGPVGITMATSLVVGFLVGHTVTARRLGPHRRRPVPQPS